MGAPRGDEPDPENPYRNRDGVPYNLLGITDAKQLHTLEYRFAAISQNALLDGSLPIPMQEHNFERLSFIHRKLFEQVYEWAGRERTIDFTKAHPVLQDRISAFAETVEFPSQRAALAEKASAFLRGTGSAEAADQLTDLYAVANYYHPFPEGNGRATQTFMRLLARERSYDLNFKQVDPTEWNPAASLTTVHGRLERRQVEINGRPFEFERFHEEPRDLRPMRALFGRILSPSVMDYQATPVDCEIAELLRRGTEALGNAGYDLSVPGFAAGLEQAISDRYASRAGDSPSTPLNPGDHPNPPGPRSTARPARQR